MGGDLGTRSSDAVDVLVAKSLLTAWKRRSCLRKLSNTQPCLPEFLELVSGLEPSLIKDRPAAYREAGNEHPIVHCLMLVRSLGLHPFKRDEKRHQNPLLDPWGIELVTVMGEITKPGLQLVKQCAGHGLDRGHPCVGQRFGHTQPIG